MKSTIFVLTMILSVNASAATFYFVDGKQVANAGAAKKASAQNPKAVVTKLQSSQVHMDEETYNLKKTKDLTAAETAKLAQSLK